MSYIGKIGVSRLDPINMYGLDNAILMIKEKYDPTLVKIETGWERGIDGFYRFEISDFFKDNSYIEELVKICYGSAVDIHLLFENEILLKAYPEFEDLKLYAMYSAQKGTAGYYNPDTNGMVISMGNISDKFEEQIGGILLHEMQHLIQEIEGFAKGGCPKILGKDKYHRLAGEVEARNVCNRNFLTKDEKRRKLRTETQDVPDNRQIIRFK